ncbi:hypothetical protein ACRALDRAFT_2060527 [Sodiomyces alcalophilus JCM 7366]|uniref:uncharacterized protein n=1 Tax=Sodiomyces alcalophilus JCM 7366 TaxID=591952 RepID=UPI0039B4E17A
MTSVVSLVRQRLVSTDCKSEKGNDQEPSAAVHINRESESKDREPSQNEQSQTWETHPTQTTTSETQTPSPARDVPSSGFELIDLSVEIGETWVWYSARKFYPVRIGEIFQGTSYQVIKLGLGSASTTWLS